MHTQDNGYLLTGISYSYGGDIPFHYGDELSGDAVIIKTDSAGNILWLKNLGGSNYDSPLANPVEISRGIYEVHIYSSSDDFDLQDCPITDLKKRWIILFDSIGNITKQKFMSAEDDLYASDGQIIWDQNKTIIIGAGNADSELFPAPEGHADEEGAVAIFDTSLTMTNMYLFGGSGLDRFGRCITDFEGSFYIFGFSESTDFDLPGNYNEGDAADYWIVNLDSNYDLQWSKNFGGSEHVGDIAGSNLHGNMILNSSGLYVLTGCVTPETLPDYDIQCGHLEENPNLYNFMDAWVVAFDLPLNISDHVISEYDFSIFPNPCNNILNILNQGYSGEINVVIYDSFSRTLFENSYRSPADIQIPINNYLNGIFYLKIFNAKELLYSSSFVVQN
jgi:hypothetical protein